MPSTHEILGRTVEERENLRDEYRKLMTLVVQMQNGVLTAADVTLDFEKLSWSATITKPDAGVLPVNPTPELLTLRAGRAAAQNGTARGGDSTEAPDRAGM